MTQTPPTENELPPAATHRVREIADSDLIEYVSAVVVEFQHALDLSPIATVTDVYAVGSALTSDFRPGKSDLDVVLAVDEQPADTLQNDFWRHWADGHSTQRMLETQIEVEYTKTDVVGIHHESRIGDELQTPHYRL